jgi:hypothetical protein
VGLDSVIIRAVFSGWDINPEIAAVTSRVETPLKTPHSISLFPTTKIKYKGESLKFNQSKVDFSQEVNNRTIQTEIKTEQEK